MFFLLSSSSSIFLSFSSSDLLRKNSSSTAASGLRSACILSRTIERAQKPDLYFNEINHKMSFIYSSLQKKIGRWLPNKINLANRTNLTAKKDDSSQTILRYTQWLKEGNKDHTCNKIKVLNSWQMSCCFSHCVCFFGPQRKKKSLVAPELETTKLVESINDRQFFSSPPPIQASLAFGQKMLNPPKRQIKSASSLFNLNIVILSSSMYKLARSLEIFFHPRSVCCLRMCRVCVCLYVVVFLFT